MSGELVQSIECASDDIAMAVANPGVLIGVQAGMAAGGQLP